MSWRAALPVFLGRARPPLALYCHGGELVRDGGGVGRRMRTFVLARVDRLIANSNFTAGLVRDATGREAIVIHPPIGEVPADPPTRARTGAVRVLSVGRLVPNKGHDRLVRAIAAVRAGGVAIELTIVGSGPEEPALRALITELGLREVAHVAGGVSDDELASLYDAADVFALLSVPVGGEVEGFGIVFLEANAHGLPVVAGRSGGSQEAVAHGVSGFVVDNHDEAVAALTTLATDPDLRAALGDGGRDRLAGFSLDHFGDQLRIEYSSLGKTR
jgi:phosphatidylinositol alpha-1,6-mannosyltransferase